VSPVLCAYPPHRPLYARPLGGGLSNLGTTKVTGTVIRLNKGSAGGGIATGNTQVTLRRTVVQDNIPDNCSPLNTIPGCDN
jgi:hypothetical protein